jgi:alpha-tubulin suppressor-like RCC1 family protein
MKTPQTILLLLHFSFTCSIIAAPLAGEVIGWGYNYGGQATGNTMNASPGLVTIAGQPLTNAIAISAGQDHCLALKGDTTVVGWGYDESGAATGVKGQETGSGPVVIDGQVLSNVIAVSASTFSMALKDNGTVVVWGDDGKFSPPVGTSNIVAISAGFNRGLALKVDGTVVGWGQIRVPFGLTNIIAIDSAKWPYGDNLALRNDGTLASWGPYANKIPNLTNIVAIAAGGASSLALRRDGTVVQWNTRDNKPQLVTGLSNVVAIAMAGSQGFGLKVDGTLATWGFSPIRGVNPLVPPAGLSNVVAVAGGGNCLAITTNHAVAEKFMH